MNGSVGWDNGAYMIADGTNGRKVDADTLAQAVVYAASTESRVAAIPSTPLPADISAATLPALGLDAVLGAGDSSFEGSSDARAENVVVAATHVSSTLIAPGQQFSFNQSLGPITIENGYVEGKIIQGDWYTSDLGGGVCQVSTTVYRAALYAGMHFDEWHAHSFRVSFYELDGWPPGIDAAIYQPNAPDEWELDLKFTNPSDTWMLLQMTEDSGHFTAQLIGTPDGITITLDAPTLSDPIAPPEPQERKTDSLPKGQRQMIQQSAPGVIVTLTRTFNKDGSIVDQDTFVSDYAALPEIWNVGTGSDSSSG
ncbi:MAG: VanW family protein [Thermomicrobiales bacterium]